MAIIRSYGTVQTVAAPTPYTSAPGSGNGGGWAGYAWSYQKMYSTQSNLRTCIDFLARNVAQLGLHAFRRKSDTDRERLADHPTMQWLRHPNPSTTRYRLFESTMIDMGIYFNAFWLKVRLADDSLGLVRLPPDQVEVEGGLFPSLYRWIPANADMREFAPEEIVHFGGYDPCNPLLGLSPLETLRRTLTEDIAAQDYRAFYWRNHARMDGVLERDKDSRPWKPEDFKTWREQWNAATTGRENSGKTQVLMPGMKWVERSFSAKDSELSSARKLTREECARAYHIPLPMVGILDHATFSNIKEQHKNLYQDALGPWLVMLEEELERQLLPESDDVDGVYFEFNIAEKLKGSFEEQADGIMKLTGRPIMTANEGRARLNLPAHDDPSASELSQPLNTSTPSQTSDDSSSSAGDDDNVDDDAAVAVIERHRARQAVRLEKLEVADRPAAFNLTRYNAELSADLVALGFGQERARRLAERANGDTLRLLTSEAAEV